MLFVLSKILFFVLAPLHLAVLLLTGAIAALPWRRFRLSRALGLSAWLVLLVFAVLPTGPWLMHRLEGRIAPVDMPRRIDGIIVLGGFTDTGIGLARGVPQVNGAFDRLTAFADLARAHPNARLVFAGGDGSLRQNETPEGQMVQQQLDRMRVYTKSRIKIDAASRNTYENALEARALARPRPREHWVMVTSGWHMPRALGAFYAAGWPMLTPLACDFQTAPDWSPWRDYQGPMVNLAMAQTAIREIGGRLVYKWTGRWREMPVQDKQ